MARDRRAPAGAAGGDRGTPAAVSGNLRGQLRIGSSDDWRTNPVCVVSSPRDCVVVVDTSDEAHVARVKAAADYGVRLENARYALVADWR
jgi:hypothetical protein